MQLQNLRRRVRHLASAISLAILIAPFWVAIAIADPVPGFANESVLSGLNQPVDLAFLPDGRMLILLKPGTIVIADPQGNPPVASTYMTLTDVESGGERGLIAITLDPDFATNNYFYVYYTKSSRSRFRVSRFTHQGSTADPNSEFLVWENDLPIGSDFHYGGGLDFGPDGSIYLTTGDAFVAADSQDLTRASGKVLRFNSDGSIPAGNPFADGPGGNLDEVWALGLRNPFRASWDIPGDRFYIAVVGGNDQGTAFEDVKIGRSGANYGWPFCEGIFCNSDPQYDNPIYTYAHSGSGASITGGFVYRGTGFPANMQGAYFFGDYVREWIRYITFDAQGEFAGVFDLEMTAGGVVALKEGPDGALYYLDILTGSARRIVNLLSSERPVITLAAADDPDGPAPHTVNFSGAATDSDSPTLEFTWFFGDGGQATGANVAHQYSTNGPYAARLSVSDGTHTVFSDDIDIRIGTPPNVSITSPNDGDLFRAADIITYAGTGNDPDGVLDASNFEWVIDFVHNEHTHPGESSIIGFGGTYQIEDSGHDFSDSTGYRFILTVTDADGLSASDTVTVYPDKVNVTFATTPPVDSILLDGVAHPTPFVHDTLIGFHHEVSVPLEICIDGTRYTYQGWSDSGAATHIFTVPNAPTNLTAMFGDDGSCARVIAGLQALYDFSAGSGPVVQDRSGNVPALDLTIADTSAVTWMSNGGLSVDVPTVLATTGPATRLRDSLQATGELTMEAWLRPGDLSSLGFGPARIVAFSQNGFPDGGNFLLGQRFNSASDFTARVRTSLSNQYGSPDFLSPVNSASPLLTHVAYTRSSTGQERIYLDGTEVGQGSRTGALTNWGNYPLALANEPDQGRPWLGELWLVAIYDRVLDVADIGTNFLAGPVSSPPPVAPTIDIPPASASVPEGQAVSFSVVASGTAPLTYQWERDLVALPGETGPTLLLPAVSPVDDGAGFRCTVTNTAGSVSSAEAILAVTPPLTLGLSYMPPVAFENQFFWWGGLAASGGEPPYTFSISNGFLHFGLTLDPDDGVILGIPSDGAYTANFTVQATDANSTTATLPLQIIVQGSPYTCGDGCHSAVTF